MVERQSDEAASGKRRSIGASRLFLHAGERSGEDGLHDGVHSHRRAEKPPDERNAVDLKLEAGG